MLGFFCFNMGFIGDFLPLWFTKESYLEYAAQMMDCLLYTSDAADE